MMRSTTFMTTAFCLLLVACKSSPKNQINYRTQDRAVADPGSGLFQASDKGYEYREFAKEGSLGPKSGRLVDRAAARPHPRLLVYNQSFEELKAKARDPFLRPSWLKVKHTADALLEKTGDQYKIPLVDPQAGSSLGRARTMRDRVFALALSFRVTGETSFVDRLWSELSLVTDPEIYRNWGTYYRGIDNSEMCFAVALAYDWLFYEWSENQRQRLQAALKRHAIDRARSYFDNQMWWTKPVKFSNWNFVGNAGFLAAGLALGRDMGHEELIEGVLQDSLASLKRGLDWFDVNGGNPEGLGYWLYAMDYLAIAVESLKTAAGDDEGLLDHPGLRATGRAYRGLISNTSFAFGYGDSGCCGSRSSLLQWLGAEFEDDFVLAYANEPIANNIQGAFTYLLYFTGIPESVDYRAIEPVVYYPHPRAVVLRNNWTDPQDMYLAIKGGNNQASHIHLDHGTFNFQVDAFPWFEELGIGNYSLPGYFEDRASPDSPAYDYYRIRTEGQNTVVLNPGEEGGQRVTARSEIWGLNRQEKHGVVNLTNPYDKYLRYFLRGFAFIEDGRAAMIKDHISQAKQRIQYNWMAHTRVKKARFIDEQRRALVLYETGNLGRRLLVAVKEPGLAFAAAEDGSPLHPAEPMASSPSPFWDEPSASGARQKQNENWRKVILRGETDRFLLATVLLYPLETGDPEVVPEITDERYKLDPAAWNRGEANLPRAPLPPAP